MQNQININNQNNQQIDQNLVSQPIQTSKKPKINCLFIGLVLVVCLILFGIGKFYLRKQSSKIINKKQNQRTSLPIVTINTTTSNWKTYTNSNFGVSFRYPGDIFVYEGNPQTNSQYWSNKFNGSIPRELSQDGVWMNLSVTKLNDAEFDFWSNKINSDQPGLKTATSSEVLKIININGIRGIVYYNLSKSNFEPTYDYTAMWLKDKMLYKLSIAAFTNTNLTIYKNIFYKILATFQFTNLEPNTPNTNWNNYINKNLNYSLKYPADWDKFEADNGNYVRFFKGTYSPNLPIPETYISILSKDNASNKTVKDWLISEDILSNSNNISTHIQEKNVVVGGISAIQTFTPINGGQETIYIPIDNRILQITYVFKGENLDEYDKLVQTYHQILLTLEFQ